MHPWFKQKLYRQHKSVAPLLAADVMTYAGQEVEEKANEHTAFSFTGSSKWLCCAVLLCCDALFAAASVGQSSAPSARCLNGWSIFCCLGDDDGSNSWEDDEQQQTETV